MSIKIKTTYFLYFLKLDLHFRLKIEKDFRPRFFLLKYYGHERFVLIAKNEWWRTAILPRQPRLEFLGFFFF